MASPSLSHQAPDGGLPLSLGAAPGPLHLLFRPTLVWLTLLTSQVLAYNSLPSGRFPPIPRVSIGDNFQMASFDGHAQHTRDFMTVAA